MMDTNDAIQRMGRMWKRLGSLYERNAYERAKSASAIDRSVAVDFAKTAEACFWRATGDCEAIDIEGTSI